MESLVSYLPLAAEERVGRPAIQENTTRQRA
jgi:hypothetical protein